MTLGGCGIIQLIKRCRLRFRMGLGMGNIQSTCDHMAVPVLTDTVLIARSISSRQTADVCDTHETNLFYCFVITTATYSTKYIELPATWIILDGHIGDHHQ